MGGYLSILVCLFAVFGAVPAAAQTTALYVTSDAGEPLGQGVTELRTGSDLTFSGDHLIPKEVHVRATAPSGSSLKSWSFTFDFPESAGAAPGVYDYAGDGPFVGPTRPGLRVSYGFSGCQASGRFIVYEVTADSSGHLLTFAADFEMHCNDGIPAMFGAVRFNASRSSLLPFGGAYPLDALHIDPSPFGSVSGTGIDCGNGGSDCDETFGLATTVALAATPAPGYAFLGWTGNCGGQLANASVVVAQPRRCGAIFDALPGSGLPPPLTGGTGFFVDRAAQTFLGAGRWVSLPADSVASAIGDNTKVLVTVRAWDGERWSITFSSPAGQVLGPGTYEGAQRDGFRSPGVPGFDFGGKSSGCNALRARFVIYELSIDSSQNVLQFAADFEQRCDGQVDGLSGSIRIDSTRAALIPFDGAYPTYRLTIDPPVNGSISGPGIDCNSDCAETYASGGLVALTARPAPGYVFVGWTGDCTGSSNGTVLVSLLQTCGAVFDNAPGHAGSLPAELGLGSLSFFSQRGDYIGQGQTHVWTRSETTFEVYEGFGTLTPRLAAFNVTTPDGETWTLAFSAPLGQALQPGDYTGATRYPFQANTVPGFTIFGHGRGCNELTGRFRVYQVHVNLQGKVDEFAADFEQHCDGGPALFGAFRFNSTRSSLLPFDGAPLPKPIISLNPPANGAVVTNPFLVGGWALNTGDTSGTGVDAVHVYAYPAAGGAPIFLGVASYGAARPDVGAIFGAPYTNSGYSLWVGGLAPGDYVLAAIAHDTVTGVFDAVATSVISVVAPLAMAIGPPADQGHVSRPFVISGWAIDGAAPSGSGVDAIHAWAWPAAGGAPIFLGATTTFTMRLDVAAIFGDRFAISGFNLPAPALEPGTYILAVYAHSAATGTFNQVRTLTVVVN
jgi:hypothetical protein